MVRSVVVCRMVAMVRRLVVIIASLYNLGPTFLLRDLGDISPGNQRTFFNKRGGAILYWHLGLHLFRKFRALWLNGLLTNLLCNVLTT